MRTQVGIFCLHVGANKRHRHPNTAALEENIGGWTKTRCFFLCLMASNWWVVWRIRGGDFFHKDWQAADATLVRSCFCKVNISWFSKRIEFVWKKLLHILNINVYRHYTENENILKRLFNFNSRWIRHINKCVCVSICTLLMALSFCLNQTSKVFVCLLQFLEFFHFQNMIYESYSFVQLILFHVSV